VGPESVAGMEVGMRCEVTLGGRRGEVCYVGEVPELSGGGHWVGVRFDEPVGKSHGSAKGKQYFECNDHHGGWVRGYKLKVGDYPEKEFNFDEDSDEDEI
jgi:tubulin-specific chaperone B